jgi:hypothetical protein
MVFGDGTPRLVSAPNEERRKAWDATPDAMIGG